MELISNHQCSSLFPICTFGLSDVLTSIAWPPDYDWDERNDSGHTALYAASFFGYEKVVTFLLDQGANCNVECGRLGSALHCASYRGHEEVVQLLLGRGANINVGNKFDNAIHAACRGNQEEVVLSILYNNTVMDQAQYDAAIEAVSEAGFSQAMERLHNHPFNRRDEHSKMLQKAIKVIISGNVANMKYLTRRSKLADLVPAGCVALSALHGHEAMTKYLLDEGMSIKEGGDLGSPLRCASICGSSNVCLLLLGHGASVNGNKRFGSALHAASMKGHLHIVKLLLDASANVNIRGGYYGTPLQAAAYQGHIETVSMLLRAGADPHLSGFSKDAFHAAAEGGRHETIQLLLASGVTMLNPIQYARPQACMAPPPPRNLLRESSPEGRRSMRGWRRRYGVRSRSCDQSSDDEDESSKDWVDVSNPTPNARAYNPKQRDSRFDDDDDDEKHNYPLEAAAALGHFEVVCELLAQHEFLGISNSHIDKAFIAACKNGHRSVADKVLSRMEEGHTAIRKALEEAASQAHIPVIRMLLAHDCAADSRFDLLKATLISSIAGDKQAFHEILLMAETILPENDIKRILPACLSKAAGAERADIIRLILARNEALEQSKLLTDVLLDSCKDGKIVAARALYELLPSGTLSRKQYTKCMRGAVENGRVDIVRYLLPNLEACGLPKYLQHMILVAAGCGYLEIFRLLLHDNKPDDDLLQQALNIAAENGHEKICACLLSKGVDPTEPASTTIYWSDVSLGRGRDRLSFLTFGDNDGSSSESENENIGMKKRERKATNKIGTGDANPDPPLLAGEHRTLNAIESCLSGFKHLKTRGDMFLIMKDSWWREGSKDDRSSTLNLLLESVPSMKDQKWSESICAAAKLCSPSLVASMLDKGVNAKARHGKLGTLDFAVQRERLCFPVVQALISKRGKDDLHRDEVEKTYTQAASFFPERQGRPYNHGALFLETKSLDDVFTSGPGAVIKYMLEHPQGADLISPQNSALLQCAAVVGLDGLLTLLIDHKAKLNAPGSYYGTALQAASRFGHTSTVKLLLKAGADPNIRQGRHHTALRAAVLGGSLECVNSLLEAGADTELSGNWSYRDGDEDDPTPLQLAVEHEHSEIAQALISAGADVNVKRGSQQPLLVQVCGSGDTQLICALLEANVDIETKGHKYSHYASMQEKHTSGMHAAIDSGRIDVIELLLSKGYRLPVNLEEDKAPLTFAADKGSAPAIDILLLLEPGVSDEMLLQSLIKAIRSSHFEATEKLLFHRPIVLDENKGSNLLREACSKGNVDIIELLLEELSYRDEVQSACTAVLHNPPQGKAEVFDMILEYVPCTVELFVEACARGYESIVKVGLQQGIPWNAIDSKGRPAFHFAAIKASVTVVELLLTFDADPNFENPLYGTPLRAALEGCIVKRLAIHQLPEDVQTHAHLLMGGPPRNDFIYGLSRRPISALSYQQIRHYEKIVQLLLEKGALPNPPPGPFGCILALAAFTGVRNIFNLALQNGATDAVGGYLYSSLLAAMDGGHMDLAEEILDRTSDSNVAESVKVVALHKACEKSNLLAVKLLVHSGVDVLAKNENGDSPLHIGFAKLTKNDPFSRETTNERSQAELIVHLILDTDTTTKMTNHDLIAAAKITEIRARTRILQKMIPRAENRYFPEDAYVSLIGHKRYNYGSEEDLVQRLMDDKRIQRVTTSMLEAVERVELATQLLDYDPSYTITPQTLDSVTGGRNTYNRDMATLLVQRDDSFIPSESNVLTVLQHHFISSNFRSSQEEGQAHILEVMFSRNPELKITEDMLIAVQHPSDLKILLGHVSAEPSIVTPAVIDALDNKYGEYFELLKMFLDLNQTVTISPKIVDKVIFLQGVDGIERLWQHDPTLPISEEAFVSLVQKISRRDWQRDHPFGDFMKLLREHRDQWTVTRKVRDAIDHKFQEESDRDLKEQYYSLFDDQDMKS